MNMEMNSVEQPMYNANTSNTPLIGIRKRQQQQPLLTCTAHIFQIDPITKKSWIPSSTTALPVSFFYDASRGLYRIICTDGSKTLVNSTLLLGMNFTKTSQKFGQWSDKQTNIVYGLGFSSESELEKFDEQFHEVVKETFRNTSGGGGSCSNSVPCVSSPARHIYSNGTSTLATMNEVSSANKSEICAFDNNYATIGGGSSHANGGGGGGGGPPTIDMNANAVAAVSYQMSMSNNTAPSANKNIIAANNLNNSKPQSSYNTIGYMNSPAKVLRFQQQQQMMNGNTTSNSNLNNGPGSAATLQNIYNSPKHSLYNAPLNKLINESLAGDQTAIVSNGKLTPETMQLKYENEKLRQALQQSSANSKIWEYELATLKQNNAKLTTALQECNINVEDWKHQLQRYKEENQCLRLKILDIEADVDGGSAPGYAQQHNATSAVGGESELGKQLDELRNKVNYYSKMLNDKDEQINCLRIRTGCMENGIGLKQQMNGNGNGNHDSDLQSHNNIGGDLLWTSIQTVHSQLQTTVETQDFQKKVLEALAMQLNTKLSDLTLIQDRMKEALETSLR